MQAVNKYPTAARGASRCEGRGDSTGHQNNVPNANSETVCSCCIQGLPVAALHKAGTCQSHMAPTPAAQDKTTRCEGSGVGAASGGDSVGVRRGRPRSPSAGTMRSNNKC